MQNIDLKNELGVAKLGDYLKQIDQSIKLTVAADSPHLIRPILRLLTGRRKMLRSSLMIACLYSAGGRFSNKALKTAVAIELVHLASLVHDDIIDQSSGRGLKQTINSKEGINQAIVGGDYLFAKAFDIALAVDHKVATYVAQVIVSLCDGQSLELKDQYNSKRTESNYLKTCQNKTGVLFAVSCQAGAYLADHNGKIINKYMLYGLSFGTSFQMIDDLLDIYSNQKLLSKAVGQDITNGIYTLPVIKRLRAGDEAFNKKLKHSSVSNLELANNMLKNESVNYTLEKINYFNDLATNSLPYAKNNAYFDHLCRFPSNYLSYCLNMLIDKRYKVQFASFSKAI